MQETRILSTHPAPLHEPAPRVAAMGRALVFDACQVGVVLRAVLFVEVVLGVCALFGTTGPGDWLARLALLTGAALPATLLWLVTACSLKNALQRLPPPLQYAAGVLLGMLAGLYACAMLLLAGAAGEAPPWLACAASGAANPSTAWISHCSITATSSSPSTTSRGAATSTSRASSTAAANPCDGDPDASSVPRAPTP